jgi:hypothetical protein
MKQIPLNPNHSSFSNSTNNAPRFHYFFFHFELIQLSFLKNVHYSITCVTWVQTLEEKFL